ncbi:MAG: SAM-dependent chlorinase/fluorinase [Actinomycetota bacterium]|nr:SAM-dependent chlorinase/fluorinase [Actinomycetota bacterium]
MSVVTFLTDYGCSDEFVGVCHGVIARIAPQASVIDITHGVRRHDVRAGAVILRRAIGFMPVGVHLAVVDPGVGGERRAVALRCAADGHVLVGPDNGLLAAAAERLGGVAEAIDIGRSPLRLQPVSRTFHGRDIFAPVAAHLAAGTAWPEAGEPLDPDTLVTLDLPRPRVNASAVVAHVLTADGYGNVALDAELGDLAGSGLKIGGAVSVNGRRALYANAFGDVPEGELVLYEDGFGALAVAVNRGSALEALELGLDAEVELAPAT